MSLRVLQLMAGAEHGGAELFFERLCVGLHRAGLNQRVIMRPASERGRRMRDAGLDLVDLPFGGRLDFVTPLRLRKEIKRFKPDVVLSWMNRATRFAPRGDYALCARLGGFYDIKYYSHCDYLVCCIDDIVKHVINAGFPADRVVEIPNFVPVKHADPIPRSSLQTPEDVPLVLSLGRLHENKAFDTLIKAIADVPNAWLWLAGDGPLRGELETLARTLGINDRVRFLGWQDDTTPLYATADMVVFPSRHEPFGNVTVEAWSQRQALIATKTHGPGRMITDGKDGLLVPIDYVGAMSAALRRVIDNPDLREKIAQAGWETYNARYSEEKVVGAYMSFFKTIASSHVPLNGQIEV